MSRSHTSDQLRRLLVICAAAMLFLLTGGCASEESTTNGSEKVRLGLNWFPEVEHGGFYAAAAGIPGADKHPPGATQPESHYAGANLDVEIIPGGQGIAVLPELMAGRIEYGIANADQVVAARADDVPIVAIMASLQQSPRCIMVHKSSGIEKLEDIRDITLAMSDSRAFGIWLKKKLPLRGVEIVPYTGQVGEFLRRDDFAQQGYVFSEPFVATEKGSDPLALMVSETGFNPYSSLVITTEAHLRDHPEQVRRFVAASIAGWEDYLADPAKGNAGIRASNPEMSIASLQYGADAMKSLCRGDQNQALGSMTTERWETLIRQMEELGMIDAGTVDAAKCFTTQFLPGQTGG